jgi:cytoskeletal protein RodZ
MSSLIELILEQQAILISLGVVGLVILLAVAVVVGVQLRKVMAKMAVAQAQRKEAAARRAAEAAERKRGNRSSKRHDNESPEGEEAPSPIAIAGLTAFAEVPVETMPVAEATVESAPVGAAAPSTVPPADANPATPEAEAAETTDAMKDLLTSVFFDEGSQERFDNLLRGSEPIEIDALAQFSQQIAAQLNNALAAAAS